METTLFGGPPEIGNILKLANGQMGFMTIYAHPLFDAVADVMPGMAYAPAEILTNKAIWAHRAEKEKRKELLRQETGAVSPRSQSPATPVRKPLDTIQDHQVPTPDHAHYTSSPLRGQVTTEEAGAVRESRRSSLGSLVTPSGASHSQSRRSSLGSPFGVGPQSGSATSPDMTSRRSSGAFPGANPQPPPLQARRSSNTVPNSQLQLSGDDTEGAASTSHRGGSSENDPILGKDFDLVQPARSAVIAISPERGQTLNGDSAIENTSSSPSKRSTTRFTNIQRQHHQHNSSGRFSTISSQDRSSMATSGARTHSTILTPVSPSTQATSFLSDGSDDKDNGQNGSRPTSAGMPAMIRRGLCENKNNVRTSILGHGYGDGTRTVPRRRSKLRLGSAFNFWRKRSGDNESQ